MLTSGGKYKVAHLRRTYLLKREPFIGYQVTSHVEFEPIVCCRDRDVSGAYDTVPIFASADQCKGVRKKINDALYAYLRILPGTELNYLKETLLRERPSLLHFHYLPDARFFLGLKEFLGVPAIVSSYGYDTTEFHGRYFGYGKKYVEPVFRHLDAFIAMSPAMKDDLIGLGCPAERIHVHYYGIEAGRFRNPERAYRKQESLCILMVAGFDEYKGHEYLFRALLLLKERLTNVPFTVRLVGQGPLETTLREFVRKNKLEDVVHFVGFVPHHAIAQEFQKADIFVMPSVTERSGLQEGIPGALVEAMASGLPCIATRHAGIPWVLEHEKTGLLVDERDPEGLADALQRLIAETDLRATLGRSAAEKACREFDCRDRIKHLEEIYVSLLTGQAGG